MHALTDLFSMLIAWYGGRWWRTQLTQNHFETVPTELKPIYMIWVFLGLLVGSVMFGSLNLWLSAQPSVGKSFLGGLVGAIVAVEVCKKIYGIQHSTGTAFIPGLLILIIFGRIGCFYAGIDDFTYGIITTLPWAVDFGDGIGRHPVQLYESLAMAAFAWYFTHDFRRNRVRWQSRGFYYFLLYYAGQRFIWEFYKPYPVVTLGLNLFQLLCLTCIIFASLKWYLDWRNEP